MALPAGLSAAPGSRGPGAQRVLHDLGELARRSSGRARIGRAGRRSLRLTFALPGRPSKHHRRVAGRGPVDRPALGQELAADALLHLVKAGNDGTEAILEDTGHAGSWTPARNATRSIAAS